MVREGLASSLDLRGWNEQATNRDCKSVLSFGMRVRRSIFLAQQCVCLGISDHELLLWIPRQASAQLHRVVRQNARRGRNLALLDVRGRTAARVKRGKKVLH